jgi:hypothetical protein
MTLAAGTRLGPYEVSARIGAGGIGGSLQGRRHWRRDGKELFYFSGDNRLMAGRPHLRVRTIATRVIDATGR